MKAIDLAVRLATLALSMLATLAIVASLVSVSHQPGGFADTVAERSAAASPPRDPAPTASPETPPAPPTDGTAPRGTSTDPAPTPAESSALRWLQALTYALLALAGFAAAILFVLVRIAGHLARLADRD